MNKMNLKNALAVLVFAMVAGSVFGQDTAATKKPEQSKIRSYSDVITAKAVSKTGLFTTHRVDDKYYFEIPDSLLEREILFTTRLSKVATGSPAYGGEVVNSIIVSFEKAIVSSRARNRLRIFCIDKITSNIIQVKSRTCRWM